MAAVKHGELQRNLFQIRWISPMQTRLTFGRSNIIPKPFVSIWKSHTVQNQDSGGYMPIEMDKNPTGKGTAPFPKRPGNDNNSSCCTPCQNETKKVYAEADHVSLKRPNAMKKGCNPNLWK